MHIVSKYRGSHLSKVSQTPTRFEQIDVLGAHTQIQEPHNDSNLKWKGTEKTACWRKQSKSKRKTRVDWREA